MPARHLPALCLTLVLVACSSSGAVDGDAAGCADATCTDAARTDAARTDAEGVDCATWNPGSAIDPETAAACDPEGSLWRACPNGAAGYERCRFVEVSEDVSVHRWGPCEEACTEAQADASRACEVGGGAGVQHCGPALGLDAWLWQACVPAACVACTPGETKPCGPGTNYPDTLMRCLLSDGVPVWFDGDCWT
jgi:hypothetical protein